MISRLFDEREADAAGRPARIGVQHRDHDRHVGAADRHDQQETRTPATAARAAQKAAGDSADDEQHDQQRSAATPSAALSGCWPGKTSGRPDDEALQFGEGDDRAGKGDRADRQPERHLDEAAAVDRAAHADAVGLRRGEGGGGDADRGEADQAVERRRPAAAAPSSGCAARYRCRSRRRSGCRAMISQ